MSDYFLSYSRKDQGIALRFADDLIAAGVDLWVDQFNVRPSEQWDRVTEAALIRCSGVIAMLSPHSVTSDLVRDEIADALDRRKAVIPVMIADCTPPLRLRRIQYIDARNDYRTALASILTRLGERHDPPDGGGEVASERTASAEGAAPAGLTPEEIDAVRGELLTLVGPVAQVLVRRALPNAANAFELRSLLGHAIADKARREAFQAGGAADQFSLSAKPAQPLGPEILERLARELMGHLGPIAHALVRREVQAGGAYEALCERLASKISDPRHRRDFLQRALVDRD